MKYEINFNISFYLLKYLRFQYRWGMVHLQPWTWTKIHYAGGGAQTLNGKYWWKCVTWRKASQHILDSILKNSLLHVPRLTTLLLYNAEAENFWSHSFQKSNWSEPGLNPLWNMKITRSRRSLSKSNACLTRTGKERKWVRWHTGRLNNNAALNLESAQEAIKKQYLWKVHARAEAYAHSFLQCISNQFGVRVVTISTVRKANTQRKGCPP